MTTIGVVPARGVASASSKLSRTGGDGHGAGVDDFEDFLGGEVGEDVDAIDGAAPGMVSAADYRCTRPSRCGGPSCSGKTMKESGPAPQFTVLRSVMLRAFSAARTRGILLDDLAHGGELAGGNRRLNARGLQSRIRVSGWRYRRALRRSCSPLPELRPPHAG